MCLRASQPGGARLDPTDATTPWCGVVWCGVVWCGVVWVVWCGVGVVWWKTGNATFRFRYLHHHSQQSGSRVQVSSESNFRPLRRRPRARYPHPRSTTIPPLCSCPHHPTVRLIVLVRSMWFSACTPASVRALTHTPRSTRTVTVWCSVSSCAWVAVCCPAHHAAPPCAVL